jgi:hypothetical protein
MITTQFAMSNHRITRLNPPQLGLLVLLVLGVLALNAWPHQAQATTPSTPNLTYDLVFIARAHLATPDDIFANETGPAGQFGSGLTKFAPNSKLMIRKSDGTLLTLVDGQSPTSARGNLIDVQAPDVSFDGTKLIFAGATTTDPAASEYGWRLYEIKTDGTSFRKLPIPNRPPTFTIPHNNPNNYDFLDLATYGWWNDLFPAYLADGRIVFASSRYPTRSPYDGRHTYNLYVVNSDGTNLHRITTDRGGLLHPTPLPNGRIMATRWWNNFNQPSDKGIYNRIDNQATAHLLPDGTWVDANSAEPFNAATGHLQLGYPIRDAPNTWHIMTLNPDGTGLARFAFTPYSDYNLTQDDGQDTYTALQPALLMAGNQWLIAYTSQPEDPSAVHSTHKTGIRIAHPDATLMYSNTADAVAGLTFQKLWTQNDNGPPYALHPWGTPDNKILFSYALTTNSSLPTSGSYTDRATSKIVSLQGSQLQYQLYTMNTDGSSKTLITMSIGTADAMDAKSIISRTIGVGGWVAQADTFTAVPNDDPRLGNVPNTLPQYPFSLKNLSQILTATINNPNVYANPSLDLPYINNSPMPGTIAKAQVYIDANQFTGAACYNNYPAPCTTFKPDNQLRAVLWTEVPVSLRGAFTAVIPADTPAFVVLRDANGRAVSGWNRGYISIAQGNAWARPGQTVQCVGCHFGHVSGSLTNVLTDVVQGWTNIAPYASVSASSTYTPAYFTASRLNDRRGWVPVPTGGAFADDTTGWISALDRAAGEMITMTWTIPMTVTKIRLVGPPPVGGDWNDFGQYAVITPYHITAGTLRFYLGATQVGSYNVGQVEPLTNGGTWVTPPSPIKLNRLTFTINATQGYWGWHHVAALNEVEVMGMATQTYSVNIRQTFLPLMRR